MIVNNKNLITVLSASSNPVSKFLATRSNTAVWLYPVTSPVFPGSNVGQVITSQFELYPWTHLME